MKKVKHLVDSQTVLPPSTNTKKKLSTQNLRPCAQYFQSEKENRLPQSPLRAPKRGALPARKTHPRAGRRSAALGGESGKESLTGSFVPGLQQCERTGQRGQYGRACTAKPPKGTGLANRGT